MKRFSLSAVLNAAALALLVYQVMNGFLHLPFWPFWVLEFGIFAAIAVAGGVFILDYHLLASNAVFAQKRLVGDTMNKPKPLIRMLKRFREKKLLKKNLASAVVQIRRHETKRKIILSMLEQDQSLNGDKCHTILMNVSDVFYGNIRSLIAQASVFDQQEYRLFKKGKLELATEEAKAQKEEVFQTLADHADAFIKQNEEILLQMDSLALELTRSISSHEWDTNTILTMQHLDSYLAQKKQEQDLEKEAGEEVLKQLKGEQP